MEASKILYDELDTMVEKDIKDFNGCITRNKIHMYLMSFLLCWNVVTAINGMLSGSYWSVASAACAFFCIYWIKVDKHEIKRFKDFIKISRERLAEAQYIIDTNTAPGIN